MREIEVQAQLPAGLADGLWVGAEGGIDEQVGDGDGAGADRFQDAGVDFGREPQVVGDDQQAELGTHARRLPS